MRTTSIGVVTTLHLRLVKHTRPHACGAAVARKRFARAEQAHVDEVVAT